MEFPSPGEHNIVKSRTGAGECLKCGLCGSWSWIKTQECKPIKPATPTSPAMNEIQTGEPISAMNVLSTQLCEALESEDNSRAVDIVELMEVQDAHERLQDEELVLQLLQEEMQLLELSEQLEELKLEEPKVITQTSRPPATPASATTTLPVVKPPAVCF